MSRAMCLGQPPLPPKKSRIPLFFLKSGRESNLCQTKSSKSQTEKKKKKEKRSDMESCSSSPPYFSCTYRSFGKDIYDDSMPLFLRNSQSIKCTKQDQRMSTKMNSGLREREKHTSVSSSPSTSPWASSLSLARSHSDSNLSRVSGIEYAGGQQVYSSTYRRRLFGGVGNLRRGFGGSWKNLLVQSMPVADEVNGGNKMNDSSGSTRHQQKMTPLFHAKKVPPPIVPPYRHSGSSFGSVGYSSSGSDDGFPSSSPADFRSGETTGHDSDCYNGMPETTASFFDFSASSATFPCSNTAVMAAGNQGCCYCCQGNPSAVGAIGHYHQYQYEDQGIDMTQSPGRESPGGGSSSGSGSRHSTVSVDSGRASGSRLTSAHSPSCYGHCSCTLPTSIERLLARGVPDEEVMRMWLTDFHFEEYFPLFRSSGYDMHTVICMTPEDLTAVGIKNPNHRKKLKAEISKLNLSDGLPHYIPATLAEWLMLLRLEDYRESLIAQGYSTIDDVLQLTWEDLEDIGIVKLGHQKRILLAIKRVKDLKAGKLPPSNNPNIIHTKVSIESASPCSTVSSTSFPDFDYSSSSSNPCNTPSQPLSCHSYPQQSWDEEMVPHCGCLYPPDFVVPIKVRTGQEKSLENLKESMTVARQCRTGTSSFCSPVIIHTVAAVPRHRSFDDGDITPTNETGSIKCSNSVTLHEGAGTLPRPRGLVRPRPIAKIPAMFAYKNNESSADDQDLKRKPPSPPKRHSETVTVVADLHCNPMSPDSSSLNSSFDSENKQLTDSVRSCSSSDSNLKSSSSSMESDIIPFANENAGTIKQRAARSIVEPFNRDSGESSHSPTKEFPEYQTRQSSKDPGDVLDDIGSMLANLTDELDAMLEEERRQGLVND